MNWMSNTKVVLAINKSQVEALDQLIGQEANVIG